MLKKTAVIGGIAASLMLAATPAFAATQGGQHGDHGGDGVNQIGLVNINDVDFLNDVSGALGVCGNDLAVAGVTVPILSPDGLGSCAASGVANSGVHD